MFLEILSCRNCLVFGLFRFFDQNQIHYVFPDRGVAEHLLDDRFFFIVPKGFKRRKKDLGGSLARFQISSLNTGDVTIVPSK